jgi:sulfoxide reductase heme-binding subunit YedZ
MPVAAKSSPFWLQASVWLVYVLGLTPAVWEFYLGATGQLGPDPVKTFERDLGLWALRFLILTLAVSPLRAGLRLNGLRYRRALGLLCFYYAAMHFTAYLVLDQMMALSAVWADVVKRPFMMLGMASLLLLVPLAATSNSFAIRRLGPDWRRLHRLIYVVAILVGLHYALATKVLSSEQYFHLAALAGLLLWRIYRWAQRQARRREARMARAFASGAD